MTARSVRTLAPAKVNLTLHVTGKRGDGYHELDTLVAFAPACDRLAIQDGNTLSLTVEGPEAAGVPADMKNLALQAAALLAEGQGASLTLEKHLPMAAGIGGGSADAAAAIRAMLFRRDDVEDTSAEILGSLAHQITKLGADIPMCLMSKTCRANGIGEQISFVDLPALPALLVNPRVGVSTPQVFAALESPDNPPMPEDLPTFATAADLTQWLGTQRNDLEAPALGIAPVIGTVLDTLRGLAGCELARMSGSGATCFGLFADKDTTLAAEAVVRDAHPKWWVSAGALGDLSEHAVPTREPAKS